MDEKKFRAEIRGRAVNRLKEYYGLNRRTLCEIIVAILGVLVAVFLDFRMRGISDAVEDFFVYLTYTIVAGSLVLLTRYLFARREVTYEWQNDSLTTIKNLENELHPERIRSNVKLIPLPREEGTYAIIEVENNNDQDIILHGTTPEITNPNGKVISGDVNPNNSILTWGGSSKDGRKTIEHGYSKFLNIAEIKDVKGLLFLFRSWNNGFSKTEGIYKVESELRGEMGERQLKIPFGITIDYRGGKILAVENMDENNE